MCALLLALSAKLQAQDGMAASTTEDVQTIVIEGRTLEVKTLVDRKVYDVRGDIQAAFGTVSDVLGVIPSVDVDPDGTVSFRGDSNVLILIDGKPSALLSGAGAGDNLRAISARDIERIEILSTPPAQFKAEGVSGVINIILRKKRPEGTTGTLQAGIGDSGRHFTAADASYHAGGLTASVSAGYRHDVRQRTNQSEIHVRADDPADGLNQTSSLRELARRQIPTASAKVSYEIDERQAIDASFGWLRRGGLRTYTQRDATGLGDQVLTSSGRESRGHDPESEMDQRLSYKRQFARDGEELELSLHRSTARQRERYDYTNFSELPLEPTGYNYLRLLEDETTTELGADYTLPVQDGHVLKLGYTFEQTDFHYADDGASVAADSGAEQADPNLTNNFKFQYRVNAGYASYEAKMDPWTMLLGLRAEYTDTASHLVTDNSAGRGNYVHAFPSLHLVRKLSDASTLSFGASRRIRRPDPDDLNPYIDREYTPELRSGNAGLRPQLTRSFEAGYGYEGSRRSFQLTIYQRQNSNSTTEVTRNLDNGFSLTTKANLPKNDSAGIEMNSSGKLLPGLNYSVSANPFYLQIDAPQAGTSRLESTTGVNAKLKLDYRPTPEDSAQLTFARVDKRLTPQGYVSATNLVNLGYKRRLSSDLTMLATISDALDGQKRERFIDTSTEYGSYVRAVKGRSLYVGVIYAIGSTKGDDQFSYEE